MEKNQMVNQHMTDEELKNKQELAVELIANGKTDVEVAKVIRVSRQTVNEWKNHDVEFQLDLKVRRREIIFGMRDKMNELVMISMGIIQKNLENKNPKVQLNVALQIMKMATRLGIGREETDKEFKEKDRKFTMVVLAEALKDNELVQSYSKEEGKGGTGR
jgi:DNA-binding XRE family transcriptional regulator